MIVPALAYCAINFVGQFRSINGINIRFHRFKQLQGRIRKLTEYGLTANDGSFIILRNVTACTNDLLKL